MLYCDLHNHSRCSDGADAPAKLVDIALEHGLKAIALTDHNTLTGLPEFLRAAEEKSLEVVPGVEITSEFSEREYHILALFVRPECYDTLEEKLSEAVRNSERSKRELVERLQVDFPELSDYDTLVRNHGGLPINRSHIAEEMLARGYVSTKNEAFTKYIDQGKGYYFPAQRLDALDVIRLIRKVGAVAVLAHPLYKTPEDELLAFLDKAVPCGLDAMEVYYSEYDRDTTDRALAIAEKYGLAFSGGSDYHGSMKAGLDMGTGRGGLAVPYEWYLNLRGIHERRCAEQK